MHTHVALSSINTRWKMNNMFVVLLLYGYATEKKLVRWTNITCLKNNELYGEPSDLLSALLEN